MDYKNENLNTDIYCVEIEIRKEKRIVRNKIFVNNVVADAYRRKIGKGSRKKILSVEKVFH